ncbi:hypothetical protein SAMN05661010_00071 [Modicisalibacter muralis]|uniref:DUF4376 domain-containing protein n=1 Tax=Modicisalibacter muralis TaxID=119000 RepID=A0A1G9EQK2_9GAMM|nr:hypothetical protein [Halomonas muralis]SDK78374.1 hypothetical protein SAMN05661010_00071 [Halomonas muralis]
MTRIWDINPVDQTIIDPAGRECPIDPMSGQPKIPGSAMTEAPPPTGEHEAAQAIGGAWQVVPDWRGHVYWTDDGERHEIAELGIEPPGGALNEAPPTPLDDLATAALARINAGYASALKAILDQYPRDETLSFDKQEAQADAWWAWYDPDGNDQAGTEPTTPYLDSMLITRPIGKLELVNRIRDKAARFSDAHGQATGKRQALEDEVRAALEAEDRDTLAALTW